MDPNAAFDLFDADKDGRITRDELKSAMETIGMRPTEDQLSRLIMGADAANNGFVSRQDFVTLISRSQPVVRCDFGFRVVSCCFVGKKYFCRVKWKVR